MTAQQDDDTVPLADDRRVSSPASTGGAGTFFEQHVDAYWLAQLLVQGIPPILLDCSVVQVNLQTEHVGWQTDDFLVIGRTGAGIHRKLAGQVKRTFTVSAADEECKKAIGDFWRDFMNPELFSQDTDRFALVTLRGTNSLLGHFAELLECARAAHDGTEFQQRLATTGFIAKKAVQYCQELCAIVGEIEGRAITAEELWPFLRVMHILSLDLTTSTGQTEALIRTLLAHTSGDSGVTNSSDASWSALLEAAAKGMQEARSFSRDDLPQSLREKHSVIGITELKALRALREHTLFILRGITSTIGRDLHLKRAGIVQEVLSQLESSQVVVVSGPAGSGKSAVAKDALELLSVDYFAFCFRAEEFAEPHFDTTLQKGQIPANAATLQAILSGQDRKVLLIESIERLLEKSTRDAFSDLLNLAADDKSLRIILTCRDYSTDLVRTSFLQSAHIENRMIVVPPLEDSELAEVEASFPALAQPLASPALRRILRNPYFLDKALQISWSEQPLPESERDFRAVFWQQIVRAEDRPADGPPRAREEVFQQLAIRRARALTAYVSANDWDAVVVDKLRRDSLIVSSEQSRTFVAPAHDVLEDWAILQWIDEQYLADSGSFRALSDAIGTQPAIRRAYRKWIAELIERDPAEADRLFDAAVTDGDVSAQFRDDTLVSLLRAPSSPEFLKRHTSELLANDKMLLKRVIHLLRVACVTSPTWLSISAELGSLFNVPDGSAWPSVLSTVRTHIDGFAPPDRLLLLGLIEDWTRGVGWWSPYPAGSDSVVAIAHSLLPHFDVYSPKGAGQRVLKVIAKIPKADASRFESLLRGAPDPGEVHDPDERDRTAETFRDVIFSGLEGFPIARDLPDVLVSVATNYLVCTEADLERMPHYVSPLELDTLFGLKSGLRHDFFPASAYRGPWLPLLRYHPKKGLTFLITVFNHSADWYAHPRISERVEPPFEIELKFADGTSRMQWANPRLWYWYRGTSVGPYVLQSLLMALERWLLEIAEAHPETIDAILLDLLRRSDSAALTAVVASIATGFPHAAGETLLVFLRSPSCIWLDRQRMAMESQAPSGLAGLFGLSRGENEIYETERKEADARPHRRKDLENAIANLQLGPRAASVHAILDEHRRALPPPSEQTENDRTWRLSMHRMDLRQYSVAGTVSLEPPRTDGLQAAQPKMVQIQMDPNEPDPDVKEMVDKSAAKLGALGARLNVLMWALQVFKREDAVTYDPTNWREKLSQAQDWQVAPASSEELDIARSAPSIVAAVCVRDHWQEMSSEEQDWCIEKISSEVIGGDVWNELERVQRNSMSGDRACASVTSLLVGSVPADPRVQEAFIVALTHSNEEVRWRAAWGVGAHLSSIDRDLTLRCMNAIAKEADSVDKAWQMEQKRPYNQRRQLDEIEAEAASLVRHAFWKADSVSKDAYDNLDISKWFGAEANARILAIIGSLTADPVSIKAFARGMQALVGWWDADDDRKRNRTERRERNPGTETTVSELLQRFVMRTTPAAAETILQPALDAVDRHPRELHWFVRGLTAIQDREPNTEQFWFLWTLFADRVKRARWVARLNDKHPTGDEMVSAVFLGSWWKDDVRHWKSLEGHAHKIHELFEALPPSSVVLDDYVRFLYHIGEQSLPEAFVRIAKNLESGDAQRMLKETNTVFMLEVLLQRHVYGRPLELKRNATVRDSVLRLLDLLVENGSSAAFRMRDDFVTPASSN